MKDIFRADAHRQLRRGVAYLDCAYDRALTGIVRTEKKSAVPEIDVELTKTLELGV
jgi:hypothetical protein